MLRRVKTDVNLDRHIISLMTDVPFFAEISRHIKKVPTDDIPTACVSFDRVSEDLYMGWNPNFISKLGNLQTRGTIIHELYHIIFGHLNVRRMEPEDEWNVATDCAINSLIVDGISKKSGRLNTIASNNDSPLPPRCYIPGHELDGGDGYSKIIAKLPKLKSSEYYFHKIHDEVKKSGGQGRFGPGLGNFDDHSFWDSIPDEQRTYVEGKIFDIVEKAVRRADSQADGWGNIPSELVDEIRRSVSRIVNWRQVLRQFTGTLVRGHRRTSIKRINKRYPYIHPGSARSYLAKLIIAIDQSGSVDNEMLEMFFAELRSLNKNIEIDILPFDCAANVDDIYTWKRGMCPSAKRTRSGGTNFDAPTIIANDPRNRGRWDGLLIMTDGECSAPIGSRIKRGWVIGKGQRLLFDTNELVIKLDDGKQTGGAWR